MERQMNFENFTERARGFVQVAQDIAQARRDRVDLLKLAARLPWRWRGRWRGRRR